MTVRFLVGDCREVLKTLPDESVQCCVTSPPYLGLRSYGVGAENGEIGRETTPNEFVEVMVSVFREVRRVLRSDGTCWLNLGDSYARDSCVRASQSMHLNAGWKVEGPTRSSPNMVRDGGYKPKDLMMIPHRVVMALQDDGWWVRSAIVWEKPNPMPESVDDRPTSSYENVFLLTKSGSTQFWTHRDGRGARSEPAPDYRWVDRDRANAELVEPPAGWNLAWSSTVRGQKRYRRVNLWRGADYFYDADAIREPGTDRVPGNKMPVVSLPGERVGANANLRGSLHKAAPTQARNRRNVWRIAPEPFGEAHFATMPPGLASECIKAGTSEAGGCSGCGAPFVRVTARGEPDREWQRRSGGDADGAYSGQSTKGHDAVGVQDASAVKARILAGMVERITTGWAPTCSCPNAKAVPQIVLDPFGGAGTTGLAASRLGRDAVLVELNPDYVTMAKRRIIGDAPLLAEVAD